MKSKEIVSIRIECIHPHPENPRKNLGDLSELAESIKKNGVMQNLTVIPKEGYPGEYTTIIGHRRCAAAKLAGISEVPCRIVEEMSEKEQVSTMLEENMQRNDLTVYEQAQGFQMMLNLGETEETITQKTGFSKTTIRHRLNIAKLDQEELKKKDQDGDFQLTLKDLYELEKIEDIKVRDKILKESRDSRDLVWRAQREAIAEMKAKKTKQIIDMLKENGIKKKAPKIAESERYSGKWQIVKEISLDKDVPKSIRLKETDAVYYLESYSSICVIKRVVKKEKPLTPEGIKRKQRDQDKKQIKAKMKEMDISRKEFIQRILSGKINAVKNNDEIREIIWRFLIEAGGSLYPSNMRRFFTGKEDYECEMDEKEDAKKKVDGLRFTHSMLVAMHYVMENIGDIYEWQGYYKVDTGKALMHAYEALKPYGWTFSSKEDEQILNGTYELYVKD